MSKYKVDGVHLFRRLSGVEQYIVPKSAVEEAAISLVRDGFKAHVVWPTEPTDRLDVMLDEYQSLIDNQVELPEAIMLAIKEGRRKFKGRPLTSDKSKLLNWNYYDSDPDIFLVEVEIPVPLRRALYCPEEVEQENQD